MLNNFIQMKDEEAEHLDLQDEMNRVKERFVSFASSYVQKVKDLT